MDEGAGPAPSSCQPFPCNAVPYAFSLRPGLHACFLQERVVFLDIKADRYTALTGAAASAFEQLCALSRSAEIPARLQTHAQAFLNAGLLVPGRPGTGIHRPSVRPAPIGSAHGPVPANRSGESIRRLSLGHALATCLVLKRLRRFADMIRAARRWRQALPEQGNCLYEAIAHAHALHRVTPFLFTRHDACLFRSFLLVRYLHAIGIRADWEFGVRMAPFCAHCWVEHEGIVLNDHHDTVLAYTKILSV